MIDTIKVAVCVFLLAVFQVAATPQITPSTTGPDLVVILVISLALLRGPVWAASAGFAGGVMLDSLDAQSLGLTSLLYVLVAIWASERAPKVEVAGVERPAMPTLGRHLAIVIVGAVFVQLGLALVQSLIGDGYGLSIAFWRVVLPCSIETAAFALPLVPLMRWLFPTTTRIDVSSAATA